jgi:hypothetical protein
VRLAELQRGDLQALVDRLLAAGHTPSTIRIDLEANVLRVRRSWDPRVGPVEPKSRAGKRVVPIPIVLRTIMVEHRLGRGTKGLAFGRSPEVPFNSERVNSRAYGAWRRAGLERITLHECRHTFASLMIAAGVARDHAGSTPFGSKRAPRRGEGLSCVARSSRVLLEVHDLGIRRARRRRGRDHHGGASDLLVRGEVVGV